MGWINLALVKVWR